MAGPARKHHYVPKFLLRPWLLEVRQQSILRGAYWDFRRDAIRVKERGLDSFCFQIDLLTTKAAGLPSDRYETGFFLDVDTRGAIIRDMLLRGDVQGILLEQRCEWARVLLSLDVRRPTHVSRVRERFSRLVQEFDQDPEILDIMTRHGIVGRPSDHYEQHAGIPVEDHALQTVQNLVDNPRIGGRLIRFEWGVVDLSNSEVPLVLADRPLVRINGIDHPHCLFALPIGPFHIFVAATERADLISISKKRPDRVATLMNQSSAHNHDRFVFITDNSHERWLPKYLKRKKQTNDPYLD